MDEPTASGSAEERRSSQVEADRTLPPMAMDDGGKAPAAESLELPAGPFPRLPTRLGRYRIDRLLGRGAMGAVFLAHDTELERPVAIKVPIVVGHGGSDVITRLVREGKAAAVLSHPNICRVYDAGIIDDTFFIAMEFIEGRQLAEYISPTQPPEDRRCVAVIRKLAGALAEAHSKGIVHRDIKPANILLNSRGEPILTDFGLARVAAATADGRVTQSGMLVGSPAYMSPEQTTGDPESIGPQSDVYSLGIVLFELLTGRLPFSGSVVSVLTQIATKDVPLPSSLRPGLDPRLDTICRRMTARTPEDRYSSMVDVARELGDWLKSPAPAAPAPKDSAKLAGGDFPTASRQRVPPKKPDPTAESMALMERQARKHLHEQNFTAAIPLLAKIAEFPAKQFGEKVAWARDEVPAAKRKQQELVERTREACDEARGFIKAFDYHQALQALQRLPATAQNNETRQLLSEATEKFEDCMSLKDQIDEAVRKKKYDRLLPICERFLTLSPNNARIQKLADNLSRNRAERAARNYSGASRYFDVAGRLVEPREVAAGLGIVAILLFGVNWMIQSYVADVQARAANRHSEADVADSNEKGDRPDVGGKWADAKPPKGLVAPFSAHEARDAQEAWSKYLGVPIEYSNAAGMKFRLIPPGEFIMGSTDEEIKSALPVAGGNVAVQECIRSEAPRHKVILTKPYYFGTHEVTQEQYLEIMKTNPSFFSPTGKGSDLIRGKNHAWHPVESVSWEDAAEFCRRLNVKERREPMYARIADAMTVLDGDGYQLPTEAQWEFAARAGTTSRYWIGDSTDSLSKVAWTGLNSGKRTHAAKELEANPFGLYDVHGNVYEWVQDAWDGDFYQRFQNRDATDPVATSSASGQWVIRGGGFANHYEYCRSSYRYANKPDFNVPGIGFRIALSIEAVKAREAGQRAPVAHVSPPPKSLVAPFSADEARQGQEVWSRHLRVPVEYVNSIGMKFRLIPPGEFVMGGTSKEIENALQHAPGNARLQACVRSEAPQHQVILTRPYYVGVYEVTQSDYRQVVGENPSAFAPSGRASEKMKGLDNLRHPVEMVSWEDAVEFCRRLNEKEKHDPMYARAADSHSVLEGNGYTLPTEAQWEYAARAGTMSSYWNGNTLDNLSQVGWHNANSSERTHAVGELAANPFGTFDMHGNVHEWVQDGWEADFYKHFENAPATDPFSSDKPDGMLAFRGGSFSNSNRFCRSSQRNANARTYRIAGLGFRITLSVDAVRTRSGPR